MFLDKVLAGLPRCPQCGVTNPLLTILWGPYTCIEEGTPERAQARNWATYECSKCHKVTLASSKSASMLHGQFNEYEKVHASTVAHLLPRGRRAATALPPSARTYLQQAFDTLSAPDASVVMAAAAIDSMMKEIGYKDGNLYPRINKAVEDHKLTDAMGKWAHAVRLEANSVRHADEDRPHRTADEAQKIVEFATALGDFLFVFTARVNEGIASADDDAPLTDQG